MLSTTSPYDHYWGVYSEHFTMLVNQPFSFLSLRLTQFGRCSKLVLNYFSEDYL